MNDNTTISMCITIHSQLLRGHRFWSLIINHSYVGILFDSRESLNDALEALK
jgi:hypothetical protein